MIRGYFANWLEQILWMAYSRLRVYVEDERESRGRLTIRPQQPVESHCLHSYWVSKLGSPLLLAEQLGPATIIAGVSAGSRVPISHALMISSVIMEHKWDLMSGRQKLKVTFPRWHEYDVSKISFRWSNNFLKY